MVLGAGRIRAARERAEAEGRGFSAVVADAVDAYLARVSADGSAPADRTSGISPRSTSSLGEIPVVSPAATAGLEAEVREQVEGAGDARITDLHVWRVGPEAHAAIVSVAGAADDATVRARLAPVHEIAHLTVEAR